MSAAPVASADKPFPWRWLAVVLLLTLLIRGAVLYLQRENLNGDVDNYREIAINLIDSGKFALGSPPREVWRKFGRALGNPREPFTTAYRPPLYPFVLSYIAFDPSSVPTWNIALLHLALGVAATCITFCLGLRILACRRLSGLAALLVACDPILLNQQSLVMTETLATFLAILSLWQWQRWSAKPDCWNALLGGAVIGLGVLCRPTFLPWLWLVAISVAFWEWRRNRSFTGILKAVVVFLGATLVLGPWLYRNYRQSEEIVLTTTHGGYTFYLANNREFFTYLRSGDTSLPWNAELLDDQPDLSKGWNPGILWSLPQSINGEITGSRLRYNKAFDCIKREPGMFVWACAFRIRQLWSPLPYKLSADESRGRMALRYLTAAWYLGVYALAVVGIWRLRGELLRPPWIWGVLLCLTFTVVHTFYWSNLRMRAPLMPFVALVAAAGAGSLLNRAKSPGISAVAK